MRAMALLFIVLFAAGCAQLPKALPDAPAQLLPEMSQTVSDTAQFPGFSKGDWPAMDWWKAFNDDALSDLIELALKDSPTLTVAQARLRQARQTEKLAALESDIHYSTDVSAVRQHLSENGLFPPPLGGSTINLGEASLSIDYTFDWWNKNRSLLLAAIGESRAASAEVHEARVLVSTAVADAYFRLQDVQIRSELTRKTIEKRKKLIHLAQLRMRQGLDSELPYRRLAIDEAADEDALKALEYDAQGLRYRLAALTGNGPDWAKRNGVAPKTDSIGTYSLPKQWPVDWIAHRPDLIAQRWRIEAASERIGAAKADFYPNVDLKLLVGLQSTDLGRWLAGGSRFGSFGPAVHLPLFNTNTLRAKLGVRQEELAAAVGDYNQMVLDAARQVASNLALLHAIDERLALETRAQEDADAVLKLEQRRFQAGLADQIAVLDAELRSLALRDRLSRLESDRLTAVTALTQSLGGGFSASQTMDTTEK